MDGKGKKPLSVAVEELNQGKIQILTDEFKEETEEVSGEVSDTESADTEETDKE